MTGVSKTAANSHSYTYNGKELEAETGWHDYGARMYDGQISRWGAVDAMADERDWLSPYGYVQNNPIIFIDPDGNLDILVHGENGSSINIETDLIDVEVDASFLGIDFGGNHSVSDTDAVITGLDIVGIVDPTGAADVLAAGLSSNKEIIRGAAASTAGLLPVAGDVAKIPKIAKGVNKILDGIKNVGGHMTATHRTLTKAKQNDSHHIIQDATVKDLPGYSRNNAPAVQLEGPANKVGTPHHAATQTQRSTAGGGTYSC